MLVIWCYAVLVEVQVQEPSGTHVLTHGVQQSSCHADESCVITAVRPAEKEFGYA